MGPASGRTADLAWEAHPGRDGAHLLLIHSLGTDSSTWANQLGPLAEVTKPITVDLPGHGRSPARPGEYTLDGLGEDLLAVASAAGLERFCVCGVSIGGQIALWLAANHPERVSRLVAANTAAVIGTHQRWTDRIAAVRELGLHGLAPTVVSGWVSPDYAHRELLERILIATDPTGYIGCCAALRDGDLTEQMSLIRCPTLLIGGELDASTPPARQRDLQELIRGSRLEIIEGAAHLSSLDRPDGFNRLLLEFLTDAEP